MKLHPILSFGAALLLQTAGTIAAPAGAPQIPFPDALANANVQIEKTGKNLEFKIPEALIAGNGQMNVIVRPKGKDLWLRVTKNDVWDGRIDTSEDPPIPRVDAATGKSNRTPNKNGKFGNPPSWNKPYPAGLPTGDIKLPGTQEAQGWTTELDITKGLVTAHYGDEVIKIRVLWQSNVVYIETARPVELMGAEIKGLKEKFLPDAVVAGQPGSQTMRQQVPGNEDIQGMETCMASASEGNRKAVAVVTSNDNAKPLEEAVRLAKASLATPGDELVKKHDLGWLEFWSRSGIKLQDEWLQRLWYRMVYFFRCFSSAEATAAGLKTSFDGLAGWHNSYKFNYNIQQTYFSAGPINHPDLDNPIIEVLRNYWPRARWFARNGFVGCEGAFVHSDVFHPNEPDPEKCKSNNKHQFAYIPFGYTLGMQGHISMLLWEDYKYQPDKERLRSVLYPMIKDIALFYCSFIEKCQKDGQGRYRIGPSYIPENGYFGQYNTAYDIPFITLGLRSARDAANVLGVDKDLVARIQIILDKMPKCPVIADPAQDNKEVVRWFEGSKLPDDDRHGSLVMSVFPSGIVNHFSPPEEKELFKRTINLVNRITGHANSPVTMAISRARLSMADDALANIKEEFTNHHKECPNGTFNWKAHGVFISEQVGVSRMICELLLQSVEDIIRIFPAWPAAQNAEFAGLRAQGGFLVSAKMQGGNIRDVQIESTVGGEVKLVNPWTGKPLQVTKRGTGEKVPVKEANGIASFASQPGTAYLLSK